MVSTLLCLWGAIRKCRQALHMYSVSFRVVAHDRTVQCDYMMHSDSMCWNFNHSISKNAQCMPSFKKNSSGANCYVTACTYCESMSLKWLRSLWYVWSRYYCLISLVLPSRVSSSDDACTITMGLLKTGGNEGRFGRWHQSSTKPEQNQPRTSSPLPQKG